MYSTHCIGMLDQLNVANCHAGDIDIVLKLVLLACWKCDHFEHDRHGDVGHVGGVGNGTILNKSGAILNFFIFHFRIPKFLGSVSSFIMLSILFDYQIHL